MSQNYHLTILNMQPFKEKQTKTVLSYKYAVTVCEALKHVFLKSELSNFNQKGNTL